MEQQQIIQQLQAQVQQQQQQLQQYQQQMNAPPAEEQQVEQLVEPPAPPPQLPDTSHEMWTACREEDVVKIISLIEEGESPNSVDDEEFTPVLLAIRSNHLYIVKVLFGFGADLSIVMRMMDKVYFMPPRAEAMMRLSIGC
jgi:type II secretory pathway pseudopilin PulG